MVSHLGRVWSDGDPFVLLDRALADGWEAQVDDYEQLVVGALGRGEVEIAVGAGRGVLLGHEAGEGALEVFRLGARDLLALIASYADEPDVEEMARDAAGVEASPLARIDVRCGEVVFVRAAVPWSETRVAVEAPGSVAARDRGAVATDALVVQLPPSGYAVGAIRVDRDRYGLDAWRIRGP